MKILDTPRSGSVAGVTASRNRFGQYYRTRAIPVQPRSPSQTANRGRLAVGASAWRGLDDPTRTLWNDYAAQITRSGSLGSAYSPTGAQLFTGASIINDAPVSQPPAELPTWSFALTTMAYVDSTPGPEALTATTIGTSTDNGLIVETSGPVSPGVTSAAAVRRWRTLPNTAANLAPHQFSFTTTTVALLTQYKYLFPSPVTGQVLWFRFREVFYGTDGLTPLVNRQAQTFRLVIA